MKQLFKTAMVAVLALCLASPLIAEQNIVSGSSASSGSVASVKSNTNSAAASNNNNVIQYPANTTSEITNVPSVYAPSFSSGHPCAMSPLSGGIGVLGYGVTAGGQTVDDACMLAQLGEKQAAILMIAGRSKAACVALMNAGKVAECKFGGKTYKRGN